MVFPLKLPVKSLSSGISHCYVWLQEGKLIWLVVYLPLWNILKSVGICWDYYSQWKHKKCSKPPTSNISVRICQFTASMGAESSSFFDRKNRDPPFQTSKGFFQHGHASYVLTVRVGTKKNKRRFCFYDFQTSWSIGIIRVVSCFLIKLAKMTTFNDIIYI